MKKNIEIELKFLLRSNKNLNNFLSNLTFLTKKHVRDIYYDTDKYDLFSKGIFIRVRNDKLFDFKFNPEHFKNSGKYNLHDHCNELSFSLPLKLKDIKNFNKVSKLLNLKEINSPDFDSFIKKNKLTRNIVIDKKRKSYKDKKFEYDFDIVKDLGNFLEIEYLAESTRGLETIKNDMFECVKALNTKHVNIGYVELYLRKYEFQTYLKGLYLLEEDFNKYKNK